MDASPGGCSTPPPWHLDAVGGRPHHQRPYRLYLPGTWAEDPSRRAKAGVPEEIGFEAKTAIALGQMRRALEEGVPGGVVLDDAGYGDETDFRVGVDELRLRYVLEIGRASCRERV